MKTFEAHFGMKLIEIVVLALLGLPRIVLHDLSIIEEGSFLNSILVFGPVVIWFSYILVRNQEAPVWSIFILSCLYGLILALTHQIFWHESFPDGVKLGGNLSHISMEVSTVIARFFALMSSLTTGLILALMLSGIMWVLCKVVGVFKHEL